MPMPCAVRVLRVARAQEALLEVEVLAAHRQRVEQNLQTCVARGRAPPQAP